MLDETFAPTFALQLRCPSAHLSSALRARVQNLFNNNIGDAAMKTVEGAGFRPTWNDLKMDVSREFTYNAQDPEKNHGVIDHVLYNNLSGARATDGGIIELEKPLSDHKPIWAEISFPRNLENVKLLKDSENSKRPGSVPCDLF